MSETEQLAALARIQELLTGHGIDCWLFGGWAVDFHAGLVTRVHDDLDIAVWLNDHGRIAAKDRADLASLSRFTLGGVRVRLSFMRVVALLRGINIGPKKRIAMPALRSIVESLGYRDVETYLQSGNVVFTPKGRAGRDLGPSLSAAIAEATGHDVPVVIRTGAELARVVSRNPYVVDDPTKVVVCFLADKVSLRDISLGDLSAYFPDELTLIGKEIYVSVPKGQGRSKLMEALTKRRLPTTLTVRNWRTVAALAELAS